MFERLGRYLTAIAVENPGWVTLAFVALAALGAWGTSRLEARLSYLELLPQDSEEVRDLHWVMDKAGSDGYLVSQVSGGTREERLAFGATLTTALAKLPDIRYSEFRYDTRFFREHAAWLLPLPELRALRTELEKRVETEVSNQLSLGLDDDDAHEGASDKDAKPAPKGATAAPPGAKAEPFDADAAMAKYESALPKEYIEDKDKTRLFILSKPRAAASNIGEVSKLVDAVRQTIAALRAQPGNEKFAVDLGGPIIYQQNIDHGMRQDLGAISILSLLLSAGFLLIATRRPLATLLILVPIAVAISVTLALTTISIGHLNIVSSLLVAILLGLGVEFGIHLVLRTAEERTAHDLKEALMEASPETMAGAWSGAVTNSAAFGVLLFCEFRAFREFGAIAAVGVLLSWLFTYTMLPAMIMLIERRLPGWVIRKPKSEGKPVHLPRGVAFAIVLGFMLFCLIGVYAIADRRVEVERNFGALNGDTYPDPVGREVVHAMGSTITPVVAWVADVEKAAALEKIFAKIHDDDQRQEKAIEKTISLARFVSDDGAERNPELARIRTLLKRVPADVKEKQKARFDELARALEAAPIKLDDVPLEYRRKFTSLDGKGTLVLILNGRSLDEAENLDDFVSKVDDGLAQARAQGIEVHAMSENRIAVRIFRQVFADAPFISWAATLVAFLVLYALLRSLRETLIVFTPIALGMLAMTAMLFLTKTKLNFINMAVIPSIFTVAIDNTVHLYHRYQVDGKHELGSILRHTGAAVLIATFVNGAGYGATLIASFYGLRSLGIVALFGVGGMLVSTVIWFPSLLLFLPEHRAGHP